MVNFSRLLKCAFIVAIVTTCLLNNWVYGQGSGYAESDALINVRLNGELTQYGVVLSVGSDGEKAIFGLDEDQSYVSQSGEPEIPFQILRLLLPPEADLSNISTDLEAEYTELKGFWDVNPMPPAAIQADNGAEELIWPSNSNIIDGYDSDVYGSDALWPSIKAMQTSVGKLRSYKILELAVPLYRYNPSKGSLQKLAEADLSITTSGTKSTVTENVLVTVNSAVSGRVSNLVVNYDQAVEGYPVSDSVKSPNLGDTGYVIITTKSIANASSKLTDFVAHKSSDYVVNVITEDNYGAASGDAAANNVRAWLQSNYNNTAYGSGGILYVLLIGDPRVSSSSVPMKLCRGDLPTDYYYAELTGDWDSDNDGIYGEDEDNPEKYFEVYTGRIPYYGVISDTDHILQKIIDYDNSTDTAWRRSALLPMVPLDDVTPGYQMGEQIKYDSLEPRFIDSTRIYSENYGLTPPPEYHLHDRYPATEWSVGQYGMMIWQTHGWSQGGAEVINSGDTGSLNDGYPSAVFQGSCMTGDPDATNNLGYSLMKNGAIGTVAASRNGLYWVGQTNFSNTNSVGGIGYQYAKRIAERKSLGQATYDTKEYLNFWLQNYYVYNYYGDPSTVVMPTDPDFGVSPTHGLYFGVVYGGVSNDSESITLVNNSNSSINWTASKSSAIWYGLSNVSGSIGANSSVTLNINLNTNTQFMSVGTHTDTIVIRNITTGEVEERTVTLTVNPMRKIAHWPMEETSGQSTSDVSGNGRDGTLVNTDFSTASTVGKYANGMLFDGVDDYVEVPGFSEDMNGMTISVWLNPDDWNGNRRIFQKGGDGNEVRLLMERSSFVFEIGSTRLEVSQSPAIGSWTHVAAVYDGSKMQMYYNKVLKGTINRSGSVPTSSSTMYIGSKNDNSVSGDLFKGAMDELQIFNYAKDAAGIEDLYNGTNLPEVIYPYHGAGDVTLIVDLEWMMTKSAFNNDVYFGTDYDLVLNATPASSEYKVRQSGSIYSPGTLVKNTDYYWRADQVDAAGTVTAGPVWKFTTGDGTGGITWEVWYNISGNYVSNLTGNSRYPDSPDDTAILTSMDGPRDFAENYGSRMYGFLIPPETGIYKFWLASDDYSELWLSSDADQSNISKIAYVNGATGYHEWDKYGSQESSDIMLEAGIPYYIMVLHKEGAVGDNLSVAFSGPNTAMQIIPGECLMPYADDYNWGPMFTSDYLIGATAYEGDDNFQGSVASEVWSASGSTLIFSKPAGPDWLTIEPDGSYHGTAWDGNAGLNMFEVKATDSEGLSSSAILQIKVVDMFTGEKGLEDFSLFAGNWLENVEDYNGSDLIRNNVIDISDMSAFVDSWLLEILYGPQPSYWPFDIDGNDVLNNYTGVLNNGADIVGTGIIEGALLLNGLDGNVTITGYPGITGTTSRTCMAWVNTSVSQMGIISSWGDTVNGQLWIFRVNTDGSVGVGVWGGYIHSYDTVNDGTWHHVAAVLNDDGTPDVSEIKLYIDGEAVETYFSNTMAIDTGAASDMSIGSYIPASSGFFSGMIDEFRMFSETLTSEDISRYAGRDLELYLPLDESAGSIAGDDSWYGRDGILEGGPIWQDRSGKINGTLLFDGSDDYVEAPFVLNPSEGPFTVMAWIKGGSSTENIFCQTDGDGVGRVWLYLDGSGYLSTFLNGVSSGVLRTSANWSNYSNDWHHVCVVWDGYRRYIYLDGQVSASDSSDLSGMEGCSGKLIIGAHKAFGSSTFFTGYIDDVKVYSRALSSDEVEAIVQQ